MIPRPEETYEQIGLDTIHEALADEQRRAIIRHLAATDGQWIGVDELVRALGHSDVAAGTLRGVLENNHLQLLHQYQIVEYDDEEDRVRADRHHHLVERVHMAAATTFDEQTDD